MKVIRILAFLTAIAAAFAGGYVYKSVKSGTPAPVNQGGRKILYWQGPMHPAYKSDKPGIAPDCGMKLEPVYADSDAASATQPTDSSSMPMGTVQITPDKQQLIGVKYGAVERTGGSRSIRAVGRVAFDETRIQHIHTKVEGWIDKVFVDYTGQLVTKGQPLLTIYSPDMLASQRELLLASKAADSMRNNPLPAAFDQSESLHEVSHG
jgi:membrane fusion protein, copper/silver efflux system